MLELELELECGVGGDNIRCSWFDGSKYMGKERVATGIWDATPADPVWTGMRVGRPVLGDILSINDKGELVHDADEAEVAEEVSDSGESAHR